MADFIKALVVVRVNPGERYTEPVYEEQWIIFPTKDIQEYNITKGVLTVFREEQGEQYPEEYTIAEKDLISLSLRLQGHTI